MTKISTFAFAAFGVLFASTVVFEIAYKVDMVAKLSTLQNVLTLAAAG